MVSEARTPGGSSAWQPVTPRGVAAYAEATLSRLLVFQTLFAAMNGVAVAWLLYHAVFPVVQAGIERLPQTSEIRRSELGWSADSPVLLAEGRMIAVGVDLQHSRATRVPSDVFVELGKRSVRVCSIAGFTEWRYPSGWIIPVNHTELVPWWGAWRAPILVLAVLVTASSLLVLWTVEATLYFSIPWLVAFYIDRRVTVAAAWRLCGAALMAGGLVSCLGILLYGSGAINLIGLFLMIGLSRLLVWVYAAITPLWLPKDPVARAASKNPFVKSQPS